jgi:hypothetical protein
MIERPEGPTRFRMRARRWVHAQSELDPTFVFEPTADVAVAWAIAVSESDDLVCTMEEGEFDRGYPARVRCRDLGGALRWENADFGVASSNSRNLASALRIAPDGRVLAAVRDGGLAVVSWAPDGEPVWRSDAD